MYSRQQPVYRQKVYPHSEYLHRGHLIEIGKVHTHIAPYDFAYHWRIDEQSQHTSTDERVFSEAAALVAARSYIDSKLPGYGSY